MQIDPDQVVLFSATWMVSTAVIFIGASFAASALDRKSRSMGKRFGRLWALRATSKRIFCKRVKVGIKNMRFRQQEATVDGDKSRQGEIEKHSIEP